MTKQLILFSPAGERLVLDIGQGTLESVKSEGDDATHVIVEPKAEASPSSPVSPPAPREPPPDLDIIMSVVGGAPAPTLPHQPGPPLAGPVSVGQVAAMLRELPEGVSRIVVLRSGYGR